MTFFRKRSLVTGSLMFVALITIVGGCSSNDGDHPPVHATKKVEDMTPQEKIDRIKNSPLPQQEKDREIQALQSGGK